MLKFDKFTFTDLLKLLPLAALILCCLFPPYHEKIRLGTSYTYRSLSYQSIFYPPQRGEIDFQTLFLEFVIIACIYGVIYVLTKKMHKQ